MSRACAAAGAIGGVRAYHSEASCRASERRAGGAGTFPNLKQKAAQQTMTFVKTRLGAMMFLEYVIWGSWYVVLNTYLTSTLHFSGTQAGAVFGTVSVASIVSPFFIGLVADRYFSTERVMAHTVSSVVDKGSAPWVGTRRAVGLKPTMPHRAAGMRIDPPVSEPIAATHIPVATETAAPDEEPPGIRAAPASAGLTGVP